MKNFSILLLSLIIMSCGSNTSQKTATSDSQEQKDNIIVLSNVQLLVPQGWQQEQPDSKMRIAQLSKVETPEHKLAVFYFGQQDMVEANLERWRGQFSEIESEEQPAVNAEGITLIKLTGTFKKKPFPMSSEFVETPGYGMLAAIVPSNEGPYYFKITGPIDYIGGIESDVITMMNSTERK